MPAKVEQPKHDHLHYRRWSNMIQRCYNPNIRGCNERRAQGIKVDPAWSHDNPDGLHNFAKWVEERLNEQPELRKIDARVTRIERDKDYGPDNCRLASPQEVCQNRNTTILTAELVIAMRKHKRANPESSLAEMEKLFNQGQVNISRCLRGITWSSVNDIEPPIRSARDRNKEEDHGQQRKQHEPA